jgi:hypothetical protein
LILYIACPVRLPPGRREETGHTSLSWRIGFFCAAIGQKEITAELRQMAWISSNSPPDRFEMSLSGGSFINAKKNGGRGSADVVGCAP